MSNKSTIDKNSISYRATNMIYDGILISLLSTVVMAIGILRYNVLNIFMVWWVVLCTIGSMAIFNSYAKNARYVLNFELNNFDKRYILTLNRSFLKITNASISIHIFIGIIYSIKMMTLYVNFAGDRFSVFSMRQNDIYYKLVLLFILFTIYTINFVFHIKTILFYERRLKEIERDNVKGV